MEDILVPLFFFASVFGFPLLRRQMIHRHKLELMHTQRTLHTPGAADHSADQGAPAAPVNVAELALQLPEPHRLYALALLCRLQDVPQHLDARTAYLVNQTRTEYLPATLLAYLNLTPAARQRLTLQGTAPEALLREQLELINQGLTDALHLDYAAADRLLTQGRFLRGRFEPGQSELVLK